MYVGAVVDDRRPPPARAQRAPLRGAAACRSRCSSRSACASGDAAPRRPRPPQPLDRATIGRGGRKRRRASVQLGKFNPGQKLNATFIGAAIVVMLMTGSILQWYKPFSDSWRQGATFVHDWFAIGLLFAIIGHITLAFRDPDALNGMTHGTVSAGWAQRAPPALVRGGGDGATSVGGGGALGALDPVGDVVAGLAQRRGRSRSWRRRGDPRRSGGRWRRGWSRRARAVGRGARRGPSWCTRSRSGRRPDRSTGWRGTCRSSGRLPRSSASRGGAPRRPPRWGVATVACRDRVSRARLA